MINVKSQYNCFLACLAFHVLKKKPHGNQEVNERDFINSLNFTDSGIYPPYQKPVGIHQIKKLLKANKKLLGDIQINIFGLFSAENQEIYAYETGLGKRQSNNILNLLSIPVQKNEVLKKKKKVKTQQHLVVISDLVVVVVVFISV